MTQNKIELVLNNFLKGFQGNEMLYMSRTHINTFSLGTNVSLYKENQLIKANIFGNIKNELKTRTEFWDINNGYLNVGDLIFLYIENETVTIYF